MTTVESVDWLDSAQQFGIKLGLENTRRLLAAVGNPEAGLDFIHVAGTNGKGSVCAMMDAVLRVSGRRVGLYTSPHLVDFRERIRVDGDWIGEAEMAAGLSRLREAVGGWEHAPTFFELATVLALLHFAESAVDVVVLETGMGGRLDATNVVVPRVSVITPIAMDHAEWLGATLDLIAGEKAGIIKVGVPVVSAGQAGEAERVIRARAAAVGVGVEFVVGEVPGDWVVGLVGGHQRRNAALALAGIAAGGFEVDESARRAGIAGVEWPGRFQRVGDFVLDGAHNPQGAEQLVRTWREEFGGGVRVPVIFGALRDKEYGAMLRALEGVASEFLFVPVVGGRGAEPGEFLGVVGVGGRVCGSLGSAVGEVAASPRVGGGIRRDAECHTRDACAPRALICGSLFLVGEALALLAE
jgi:dihydrofolate synthase/folylpolyglutamate synthase